ncbi:MAG: protein kinase [Deltaproteobacteria bacterium]|nr:protein kinase [Deltaproteobacteria bacterium]
MGLVYLATDASLQREVAIKVLLPRYAADERVAKRFRLEAVSMAAVRAENVVQIFAFGDYEGHPYFVMEYVPGYTVGNLIENANNHGEQLYLDVVIGILKQVCRGLEAVHARGIVHRDIKPANMLIGPRFRVAITDFGLVETIRSSAERDLAGTPLYLAPEIIRRQEISAELRFSSDIYALGISSYEMLTGQVPFDGESIKEILRRHLKEDPKPLSDFRSDLPPGVQDVVLHALSKEPGDRPRLGMDFIDALVAARDAASGAPYQRLGGPRVLIVDDDPETRTIFRTAIKVGFPDTSVVEATDGVQGLDLAKTTKPDLMFVDLNMPGMNGLELVASLRADESTHEMELVVVSSNLDTEACRLLGSLGVTTFLAKPVELSQLVDVVRSALKRR